MKNPKPTPQYYVALIIALFATSWIASSVLSSIFRPSIDANAESYIVLIHAVNHSHYSEMESYARRAQSMTSDPDIRKLSDFVARGVNLNMRAGSYTVEEANSFTGFGKGFVAGFLNPLLSIEGGMILLETLFTDFESIGNRIDQRYQPIFNQYRTSETIGSVAFWILLIGSVVGYLIIRNDCEVHILKFLQPIKFLDIKDR